MPPPATYYGFNPPFIGGNQNVLSMQVDIQLIKNDLLQLLLTTPGERAYRPQFGTPIRTAVFDAFDDADLVVLQSQITQAIALNEPRVTGTTVLATIDTDPKQLNIKVSFTLINNPLTQYFVDIGIDPTGTVTIRG